MGIAEVFNNIAKEYDSQRKILIPCFDEFYGVAVRLLKILRKDDLTIIDLGSGTGLLAALVLNVYPDAKITLVDISEKMLEQSKIRFAGREVEFLQADYLQDDLGKGYDVVISSLSIHHFTSKQKMELFSKVYSMLDTGGIFINADQVLGKNSNIEEEYRRDWYEQMQEMEITSEMLSASEERMKEDKMSTLAEQLSWLEEAGFSDVNCWYKNFIFTVFGGRK